MQIFSVDIFVVALIYMAVGQLLHSFSVRNSVLSRHILKSNGQNAKLIWGVYLLFWLPTFVFVGFYHFFLPIWMRAYCWFKGINPDQQTITLKEVPIDFFKMDERYVVWFCPGSETGIFFNHLDKTVCTEANVDEHIGALAGNLFKTNMIDYRYRYFIFKVSDLDKNKKKMFGEAVMKFEGQITFIWQP